MLPVHTIKHNMKILTSGSGPSDANWKYWPTWTKMLPLYFQCRHKDVSGPAAGNLFIARSLIYHLQRFRPDVIIAQWNFDRYDLYVGQQKFVDQIHQSKSNRNFIVDVPTGGKTTEGTGYWCSSKDNIVSWKKYYVENIQSEKGTLLDDLQNMLTLQNVCERHNIKYRFFMHGIINHDFLNADAEIKSLYDEIDWDNLIGTSIEESKSKYAGTHDFNDIEETGKTTSVPNPLVQFDILHNTVTPALEALGVIPRQDRDRIKQYCEQKQNALTELYKNKDV